MTKTFKDIQGIEEACWVGYKKVGMKKKGDRMVPNCVKEEVVDSLLGKDYVYESVADMYKGQFTKAQLAKMKQTWATKKASDVDQRTKDFVRNLDQFSQMDIKNANIKYISALIEEVEKEEFELVSDFNNIVEENEMRVLVRRNKDLKEYFSASQLDRLAKAYSVMKDRTISVSNAQKLGKMVDGIPDHALNDLRKKKIPFISGLALSRMIKRKIPVTESTYEDKEDLQEARWHIEGQLSYRGIGSYDAFEMVIDAPTESAAEDKAMKELDKARSQRKIGPGGGGSVEDADIESIERTTAKLQAPYTFRAAENDPELKEADLSKSQIKKVHKQADDLPKKDFMKRYGKDGDAVRYATATNMVKKKLGLGEDKQFIKKGELKMNESYKQRLTSAMEHYKISSLGELKDEDQKTFFNYVDGLEEGLSAGQKKLPPALQKAILAKQGKKEVKEEDAYDKDDEKPKSKPKKEDLVGGQKKLDKDKDGDLDAKDFAMLRKTKSEAVKTKETDSEPKMKDLNAMHKDSHKSTEDKPMKDMNAGYMKSNVKAPVKDNGGADMAAVKDKPTMGDPMKKINAMYSELNQVADAYTNMSASKNKMNKETHAKYLKTKPGSLEEAVLKSRGLIK